MYKKVYEKLGTKEAEKDIYRIVQIRERKTRDLCIVRCVDEDQKVLVRDEKNQRKMESILTNCSMVVLKIWMTLPFSAKM